MPGPKPFVRDPIEQARAHADALLDPNRTRFQVPQDGMRELLAHQNLILCDIAVTNRNVDSQLAHLYEMLGHFMRR